MKRRRVLAAATGLALAAGPIDATQTQDASMTTVKRAFAKDCVALITGANTGVGLGFVKVLLARGAKRVYATARRPETLAEVIALDSKRVIGLTLDVNNDAQRRAAAAAARDVTWLVNNAGVAGSEKQRERRFLSATSLEDARFVMETNFWAPTEMARLFAPIIVGNGGGAIIQILSVGALGCVLDVATYSASKGAAAMMIAGIRAELDREPVVAAGVYTGGVNTRMTRPGYTGGVSPEQHANEVLDAVEAGETDIYAGGGAKAYLQRIRSDPKKWERVRRQNI
jgi:NAD(P)-dependent dehydrogenase (short-subunit alcohol dehydrogenase family)